MLDSAGKKWSMVLNSHLEGFMDSYWGGKNFQQLKSEINILYTFCIWENVVFSSRGLTLFFKLACEIWLRDIGETSRSF